MLEAAQTLRIENPFERYPRGAFPVMDTFGMAFACTTLVRSLDPGRNSDTVQYDTLRGNVRLSAITCTQHRQDKEVLQR